MRQRSGNADKRGRLAAPALSDKLQPKGRVEIWICKGSPKLLFGNAIGLGAGGMPIYDKADFSFDGCLVGRKLDVMNIIVNQGKDASISCLATGQQQPVLRMAIGDRGTLASDPTVPKVPLATQTALFNEIYRADIDALVVNIGTPTVHQVQFLKTFNATSIPLSAFSNQANPVVNEVGLITAPAGGGLNPFPRLPVSSPALPVNDELLFSIRTFKSFPFEAANDIALAIRYTIFQE